MCFSVFQEDPASGSCIDGMLLKANVKSRGAEVGPHSKTFHTAKILVKPADNAGNWPNPLHS